MANTKTKALLVAGGLGLTFAGIACPTRELGSVRPVVQSGTKLDLNQHPTDTVDLLVMVDNSNSMAQEQANLTSNFQILVDALTQPGTDENGQPRNSVSDLHVGVISTDMGTGGFSVQTCNEGDGGVISGDDGVFRTEGQQDAVADCEATYPPFLTYDEGDDPSVISHEFACVATLGTGGCGFEQQLKAVRRALTTHADGPNQGFMRDDSLLAILMVTDEEDCSVREDVANATDIFNTQLDLGPLNLRCFNHGEQYVEPVEGFVDAILGLRPSAPERLVVAAIVGIPPGDDCNTEGMTDADFQCLLDLPAMQEVIDNSPEGEGQRLTPSCHVQGLGEAFPPRRIVEFVRGISAVGNNGIVRSICEASFRPAMEAITRLIRSKTRGACLARPIEPEETGEVRCIVQETLVDNSDCGRGRIDMGLSGDQRVCQVCQQGDGTPGRLVDELGTNLEPCAAFNETGDYWAYVPPAQSNECPTTGRVAFEGATVPHPGSHVSLECLNRVEE